MNDYGGYGGIGGRGGRGGHMGRGYPGAPPPGPPKAQMPYNVNRPHVMVVPLGEFQQNLPPLIHMGGRRSLPQQSSQMQQQQLLQHVGSPDARPQRGFKMGGGPSPSKHAPVPQNQESGCAIPPPPPGIVPRPHEAPTAPLNQFPAHDSTSPGPSTSQLNDGSGSPDDKGAQLLEQLRALKMKAKPVARKDEEPSAPSGGQTPGEIAHPGGGGAGVGAAERVGVQAAGMGATVVSLSRSPKPPQPSQTEPSGIRLLRVAGPTTTPATSPVVPGSTGISASNLAADSVPPGGAGSAPAPSVSGAVGGAGGGVPRTIAVSGGVGARPAPVGSPSAVRVTGKGSEGGVGLLGVSPSASGAGTGPSGPHGGAIVLGEKNDKTEKSSSATFDGPKTLEQIREIKRQKEAEAKAKAKAPAPGPAGGSVSQEVPGLIGGGEVLVGEYAKEAVSEVSQASEVSPAKEEGSSPVGVSQIAAPRVTGGGSVTGVSGVRGIGATGDKGVMGLSEGSATAGSRQASAVSEPPSAHQPTTGTAGVPFLLRQTSQPQQAFQASPPKAVPSIPKAPPPHLPEPPHSPQAPPGPALTAHRTKSPQRSKSSQPPEAPDSPQRAHPPPIESGQQPHSPQPPQQSRLRPPPALSAHRHHEANSTPLTSPPSPTSATSQDAGEQPDSRQTAPGSSKAPSVNLTQPVNLTQARQLTPKVSQVKRAGGQPPPHLTQPQAKVTQPPPNLTQSQTNNTQRQANPTQGNLKVTAPQRGLAKHQPTATLTPRQPRPPPPQSPPQTQPAHHPKSETPPTALPSCSSLTTNKQPASLTPASEVSRPPFARNTPDSHPTHPPTAGTHDTHPIRTPAPIPGRAPPPTRPPPQSPPFRAPQLQSKASVNEGMSQPQPLQSFPLAQSTQSPHSPETFAAVKRVKKAAPTDAGVVRSPLSHLPHSQPSAGPSPTSAASRDSIPTPGLPMSVSFTALTSLASLTSVELNNLNALPTPLKQHCLASLRSNANMTWLSHPLGSSSPTSPLPNSPTSLISTHGKVAPPGKQPPIASRLSPTSPTSLTSSILLNEVDSGVRRLKDEITLRATIAESELRAANTQVRAKRQRSEVSEVRQMGESGGGPVDLIETLLSPSGGRGDGDVIMQGAGTTPPLLHNRIMALSEAELTSLITNMRKQEGMTAASFPQPHHLASQSNPHLHSVSECRQWSDLPKLLRPINSKLANILVEIGTMMNDEVQ
eukprot:GHVN01079475.1.p1 GENE.GHVN01079475.1~~GHVN01079475.1.p1  ORF type:complete len:1223 (+),score=380.90 GHVN01079475.1:100-3768(+)